MTRDIHRAPSRLASSRPESSWKTHSTLPSDQGVFPARGTSLRDPSDYDLEQDIADGVPGVSPIHDSYERPYEPLVYDATPEAPPLRDTTADDGRPIHEIGEIDAASSYRPIPAVRSSGNGHAKAGIGRRTPQRPPVEPDYSPPAPPRVAVESEVAETAYDFAQQRGELSPSDQYQLLLYNTQLYDDEWKLLRIQAAKEGRWLRAFLIPRHSKMDLAEAQRNGRLLQIVIDTCGNTLVQEPKKPGLLRRLLNWLYGR
ncbi:MAG TPA: hypothetical protein PKD46_04910 [Aggregatilineaceae bacterium]|nr:hypothetical protein [Aggregatilineaceae bacterium]HMM27607.1 hypothetical protein [Aggregatilineaceae bacterium]